MWGMIAAALVGLYLVEKLWPSPMHPALEADIDEAIDKMLG